jgi:hypothetical protein
MKLRSLLRGWARQLAHLLRHLGRRLGWQTIQRRTARVEPLQREVFRLPASGKAEADTTKTKGQEEMVTMQLLSV